MLLNTNKGHILYKSVSLCVLLGCFFYSVASLFCVTQTLSTVLKQSV